MPYRHARRPSSIEALESRIAPAVFLIGTDSTVIHKGSGTAGTSAAEVQAQGLAGSTAAVLLSSGDTLVFDANHNGVADASDTLLLKVTAGKAMVFLTDFGGTAGGFDRNEITGMAVSNGFKGAVHTDVNGTVATALDAAGNFTASGEALQIQPASIGQLAIQGQIAAGDVLAGGSIKQLFANAALYNSGTAAFSIDGDVATGTAAAGKTVSFNYGSTTFLTAFDPDENGQDGGSIVGALLQHGALSLKTGDGIGQARGRAGNGGSIIGVYIGDSPGGYVVATGAGAGASMNNNTGGSGGNIVSSHFGMNGIGNEGVAIQTGAGGIGLLHGGAGGSILNSVVNVTGTVASFSMITGAGGKAEATAPTGAGMEASTATPAFHRATGGAGGSLIGDEVDLAITNDGSHVGSGAGGSGYEFGGAGGAVEGLTFISQSEGETVSVSSGDGGGGVDHSGFGGAINHLKLTTGTASNVSVETGAGGTASAEHGASGRGGAVYFDQVHLTGAVAGTVAIEGGQGGDSPNGHVGVGGTIDFLTVTNDGPVNSTLSILAGEAGEITNGTERLHRGNVGGSVAHVKVINNGSLGGMEIASGDGGNVLAGHANAGRSGSVVGVDIVNHGAIGSAAQIHSGTGGAFDASATTPPTGNGGRTGNVWNISIKDTSESANTFEVYAGSSIVTAAGSKKVSMNGYGEGAKGGVMGDVRTVHMDGPLAHFVIGGTSESGAAPTAGSGGIGNGARGGNGGNISGLTGRVGTLDIEAPDGGASTNPDEKAPMAAVAAAPNDTGGHGGSVTGVFISAVTNYVHEIRAGDGGDGSIAGGGGSVSHVKLAGDLGNVTAAFDPTFANSGMGGLFAGERGTGGGSAVNGSVAAINVGAHTIAAILAGQPTASSVDYTNAVTRISGLRAGALGADTGLTGTASEPGTNGGTFDYNEGSGTDQQYQPDNAGDANDGDSAIDGFVLVKKGGVVGRLPVIPLLLIQAPPATAT